MPNDAPTLQEPLSGDYDAIVVGAGVCGIYQLHRLLELGYRVALVERGDDLGGTWFWNRYPGARFDSESYTYGYSFSKDLLQEWDWKERFSSQPENLRYLNFVAEKFDLRPHMHFGCNLETATWDDAARRWEVPFADGRRVRTTFLILGVGVLSIPTLPRIPGIETFAGQAFHTHDWPEEPIEMAGKRVGVIGSGATAIQLIPEVAKEAESLTVFQRRPNWTAPLHNSEIEPEEMASIKARYEEIFATCARTPGGFIHETDRRGFNNVPKEERRALYEKLWSEPGFSKLASNFTEIFIDEEANAEMSAFAAEKIRARLDDPAVAEKLIPKDHGFGVQRLPLETQYYEAYNRPNVTLVDVTADPIQEILPDGLRTASATFPLDILIYATGFDALTGPLERIDLRGVDGQRLRDYWSDGPKTSFGLMTHGFPNMFMPSGPQSASGSTNFPRAIELAVDWITDLLEHARADGHNRIEATAEAEASWVLEIERLYRIMLMRNAQSWFTGYNSNVEGHGLGQRRFLVYNGGTPRYRRHLTEAAAAGYPNATID